MADKFYQRKYYQLNKNKIHSYCKNWQEKNKDKMKEYRKIYYQKNKDKIDNATKQFQKLNPEKMKEYTIKYRAKNKEKYANNQRTWIKNNPIKYALNQYHLHAKRKKIVFELPIDIFTNLLSSKCYYCGEIGKMGIDRLNNDIGYTTNNSVPCCWICNFMKKNYTIEFFINHCRKIVNNTCV